SSIVYGPRPAGGGRSGTAASAVGPSVFGAVCVPGLAEVVGSERLGQDHGHRGPSAGHVEDEVVAAVLEQQLPAPTAGNERIAVPVPVADGSLTAAASHVQVGVLRVFDGEGGSVGGAVVIASDDDATVVDQPGGSHWKGLLGLVDFRHRSPRYLPQ